MTNGRQDGFIRDAGVGIVVGFAAGGREAFSRRFGKRLRETLLSSLLAFFFFNGELAG